MVSQPNKQPSEQTEVYRRKTPAQRLALGMALNRQMRELMESGLRALRPELDETGRRREIARRILYARS